MDSIRVFVAKEDMINNAKNWLSDCRNLLNYFRLFVKWLEGLYALLTSKNFWIKADNSLLNDKKIEKSDF